VLVSGARVLIERERFHDGNVLVADQPWIPRDLELRRRYPDGSDDESRLAAGPAIHAMRRGPPRS
jgi:hypothetical protein